MEKALILSSDYLDILYDGRNKHYGSYELRRNYPKRMRNAVLFLLTLTAAFTAYSSIGRRTIYTTPKTIVTTISRIRPPLPIVHKIPPPLPHITTAPAVHASVSFKVPKVVKDNDVHPDDKLIETRKLENATVGLKTTSGDSAGVFDDVQKPITGAFELRKDTKPFKFVEQMPAAPYDVNRYLSEHILYPASAIENSIEGKIFIQFVVMEDGSIADVTVAGNRHYGAGLEEEAVRVVRSMPKWNPGKEQGNAVKVYFTLPVIFKLNN